MLNVYTNTCIQQHSQGVLEMLTIMRMIVLFIEFYTVNFLLFDMFVERQKMVKNDEFEALKI